MSTKEYANGLEIAEIDDHWHTRERWRGPQAGAGRVAGDVLATFQAISGNNAYGVAVQVLDVNDTPIIPGRNSYDHRLILITGTSQNSLYKLRLIYGVSTPANAEAAQQYTEMAYFEDAGAANRKATEVRVPRLQAGTLFWVKAWNVTNGATINFQIGVHEYNLSVPLPALV